MTGTCKRPFKRFKYLVAALLAAAMLLFSQGFSQEAYADESYTVLAFTSDVHNSSNNTAANRLGTWVDNIRNADHYGQLDAMGFCGDMGSASANESQFWTYTQAVMDVLSSKGVTGVYTTGNHEFYNGNFASTTNSVKNRYVVGDIGLTGDNFIIYCLGTDNWTNNSDNYTQGQVNELLSDLGNVGNDKPIFVLTHFPLHHFGSRTTANAKLVIDALNDLAASGKKIVLLWGHNHTLSDTYYDQVYAPGDKIEYSSGNNAEINFYYAAAGCMSDTEYSGGTGGSASVLGKGLVVTINAKDQLSFAYYNEAGKNVTEGGTYTEQDPIPVTGISIDEATVIGDDGQPEPVIPTLDARKTLQLHASIEPMDANRYTVAWSSSNTAIAKVNDKGLVKGVSEGDATITLTVVDNTNLSANLTKGGTFTSSVQVHVNASTSAEPNYVIAIDGYALSTEASTDTYTQSSGWSGGNTYNGLSGVAYSDGDAADDTVRWILEETEGGYYIMSLDGLYLNATYSSSGSSSWSSSSQSVLKLDETPDVWTIDGDIDGWMLSGSTLKSTNANRYMTHEEGSSSSPVNLFTVRSTGETTVLYEAADPTPVSGISLNKSEAEVEVRKSIQLTATIAPSDATNKSVVWYSDDSTVASVDVNGKVRGVGEGTAHIYAASAENSGITAFCTVTVVPSTSAEQHYVIVSNGYALSNDRSQNSAQGGSSSYTYTGLTGVAYKSGDAATDNIRWIIEETTGGYYIKDLDGNYLNATYSSGSNSGTGNLKVDSTPDVWTLDSGYALDANGEVDGSKLQSTNATNQAGSSSGAKYLGYEESPANLFTVRSSSNADTVSIVSASDPVAVTGVSLNMTEAEIEVRQPIQLVATIAPSDATNKNVSWASDNTSVATVDGNGKVRGVGAGTANITVTTVDGGKKATCAVTVVASTQTEPNYVIVIGDYALSNETSGDQLVNSGSGSQRYYYTGLSGVEYSTGDVPGDSIRWTLEETTGGYYIKDLDGNYLNATYGTNDTGGSTGVLKVDSTPDVWTLQGSLEDWELNGSTLKSTNSGKSLTHEETSSNNAINLFTIRSTGETTTLVEAEDPIAVTGISLDKSTATVEARKIVTLSATIAPEDATNKHVIWSSDDTDVATVDTDGNVKGVSEGTAHITATSAENTSISASCTVTVVANTSPVKTYAIVIDGYALSTVPSGDQLENSGSGSQHYYYTGLEGAEYVSGDKLKDNISWVLEEADGGYYIMSLDGRYLNATYGANDTGGNTGALKLDNTPDVWKLQGSLEDWEIEGSTLTSTNSGKSLTHEETSNNSNINLFTVRSDGELTKLLDPTAIVEVRYIETNEFKDGLEYIVATTKDDDTVYAVKNVASGSSSANTEVVELAVQPAVGNSPAYIVTNDAGVSWKYASSNQYMTNNSFYLSYQSSSYSLRSSSSGRAIAYMDGKLRVGSSRFVVFNNGAFAATTSTQSSGTNMRIFVKTVTIVSCDHVYGEPEWTWTGSETEGYTAATATFVCDKCGDTQVVSASLESEGAPTCTEGSTVVYTATATFEGDEYTDTKRAIAQALGHDWGEWSVTTPATCTSKGIETRECARCGETETREIDMLPHTLTPHPAVAPTCTVDGSIDYWTCDDCGGVFSDAEGTVAITLADTVVAATGHTPGEPVIENQVAATCTEAGSFDTVVYCTVCGEEISRVTTTVGALGHIAGEPVIENEVAATCEAGGSYDIVIYCSACGDELSRTTIDTPALGHDWGEWSVTTPATCTSKGIETRECARCGETETREIDMLPHTLTPHPAVAPTCTVDGSIDYWTCDDCGGVFSDAEGTVAITLADTVVAATGHTPGEPVIENEVPGTCDTPGSYDEVIYCTVCGDEISRTTKTTDELGHKWDGGVVTIEPTCTTSGEKTYTCSVCGAQKTEAIDPIGHAWGEPTYEFTADDNGGYASVTAKRVCANVPDHFETETALLVSVETIDPTDTETGSITYTFAAFENEAFEQQIKVDVLPANGHEWDYDNIEWSWTGNDEDGYTAAMATVKCKNNDAAMSYEDLEIDVATVPATCTAAGKVTYTAIVTFEGTDYSDFKEVAIPIVAHTPAEAVTENVVPATCEVGGSYDVVVYCSVCGQELSRETVTTEALGHVWGEQTYTWAADNSSVTATAVCSRDHEHILTETVETASVVEPATCTASGKTTYTAMFTNSAFSGLIRDVISAPLGHDWGEWTVTTPATCTSKGIETRECARCGETETREIDMLGHNLIAHPAVAPTCTVDGNIDYWTCDDCGGIFADAEGTVAITMADTVVAAAGHTLGAAVIENVVPATCDAGGSYDVVVYCAVCGEELSRTTIDTPALGHIWGEPTYVWAADNSSVTATAVCSRDNEHILTETVETTSVVVPATCTASGRTTYTATFKNGEFSKLIKEIVTAPLGHRWDDGVVTVEPTATEPGVMTYTCAICGETRTEPIDPLGEPEPTYAPGWNKIDGDWYYFYDNGTMATNAWVKTNGEWYYLKADGRMAANEWAKDSHGWMWMDASGKITKSKWIKDKGEWYYLKADGYMAANEWTKDSKGWMYMGANGKITKSKWIKDNGSWYYLKADGYMATGTLTINGKTYRFASNGKWIS